MANEDRSNLKRLGVLDHQMTEMQDRAIKRAEGRIEQREHLRLEIETRKHLIDMADIATILMTGHERAISNPEQIVPLTRDRIASLKAASDVKDRLIRKVLPDLKQVEITSDENKTSGKILEDIELSNRLRLYLLALDKRGREIDITPQTVPEVVDFLA